MADDGSQIPPTIAQKIALGVRHSENAIVVGNRAGVIEWANDAWTQVTGYALDASISKPVLAFLDEVDVDSGIVEFVARCFRQGRVCELEIPIHPPERRPLWIQLRVEPLRDASGEVSDFIATATDVSERRRVEAVREVAEIDPSVLAARLAQDHVAVLRERTEYDFDLALDLPLVLGDVSLLEGLVARLVCRAAETIDEGWGTITISTGILGGRGRPLFAGDLRRAPADGHYVFLEVHDTGGASWDPTRGPIQEPFLTSCFSRHAIRRATAERLLATHGGEFRMESTLWGGTSAVMLLPFA